MHSSEKKWLGLAKERGYLAVDKEKGKRVKTLYSDWCVQNQRVYICIEKSKNTSIMQLHFQFYGNKRWFTDDALEKYLEAVIPYYDPYEDEKFLFEQIEHIPNTEVERVIEDILEVIAEGFVESTVFSIDVINRILSSTITNIPSRKSRNPEIAKKVKKYSLGICELCSKSAPFKSRKGLPYLEAHHIVWISRGGYDTAENIAALCPNCHRKMHILDLAEDRAILLEKAKKHLYEPIL